MTGLMEIPLKSSTDRQVLALLFGIGTV